MPESVDTSAVRAARRADLSPLDDGSAPIYTIGQVCDLLDIGPAALRRIEDRGIVVPERSDGGHRRYSRAHIERLREAIELADEGVSLPGVQKVLELRGRVDDLEREVAALRADTDA